MHDFLGPNDMLAYLVMMTARLVELHRVLKPTGSLYLHCDPTASALPQSVMDAIFGPEQFRNEVVWKRTYAQGQLRRVRSVAAEHRCLLYYTNRSTTRGTRRIQWTRYIEPVTFEDPCPLQSRTLAEPSHDPSAYRSRRSRQGHTYQYESKWA